MRTRNLIAIGIAALCAPAFAQTQPTRPSAYPTIATWPSAFATAALSPCYPSGRYFDLRPSRRYFVNPESPCFSGTIYPSYDALAPYEFPHTTGPRAKPEGSDSLNEAEAKQRIEAKGYLNVAALAKDKRGIWRGQATMKDGRPVNVILDLEGNIYSEVSRLLIRIERPRSNQ